MIETVIKRNGTEESFQPKKIFDWVIWAEKDLGQKNVWWPVIVDVIGRLPTKVETRAITLELIEGFKNLGNWVGEMMAGRLYAIELLKEIYGEKNYPALKQVQDACWLESFMRKLDYTDEEYQELNDYIKHDLDLQLPHFAIEYMQHKYAIKNRIEKRVFETPQFIYMRMAMSLFEKEQDRELRMTQVKDMYDELAYKRVTAPTPNFTSQGTNRKASVSCVLYSSGDSADSISAGNHIAENCVTAGAGLGALLELRSAGDPIRNGEIIHEGKYFYYRAQSALATQNKQGARGGALTMYFSVYDPEVEMLINLRNPRTPEARRNRLMHYGATHNNFFMRKVLLNETYFTFNVFTAPDLYKAQFDKDQAVFEELYAKYEADENFKKNYLNAREVFTMFVGEWLGTGTVYRMNLTNVNTHTPLLEPIKQSNLCAEIVEHTRPYDHVKYLYDDSDHGKGEIATCNLAGINVAYLDVTEENESVYAKAAYYALKMVDSTILNSVYPFPHMNFTSRQRMYAGVGMHGLATLLARNGLDPRTKEGLEYVHQVAERHMYHLIQASLRISKERGVAPWIHKTRWVDGWTPLDTYAKALDQLQVADGQVVNFEYRHDWKALSSAVKENGGIAHSLLVALMPGESSTKPVGVPNNFMMIREPVISKTDGDSKIQWVAPEAEELDYTIAWDMTLIEQARLVAVLQKFTDQAISAEFYRRVGKAETIPLSEIIEFAETCDLLGVKSWYYANTNTHTDNVGRSFLTAFNKPYYDEETMKLLHGEAALEKVIEACEGCDA